MECRDIHTYIQVHVCTESYNHRTSHWQSARLARSRDYAVTLNFTVLEIKIIIILKTIMGGACLPLPIYNLTSPMPK